MYLQSGENFDFKTIADAVDSPKEEKIFLDIKIPSIDLNNYDKLLLFFIISSKAIDEHTGLSLSQGN